MNKVSISKGKKVPAKKAASMRKKPGGSNIGKYRDVPQSEMAGKAGGSPAGSFPINNLKRAKSALRLAHNAPNPSGVKAKVYSKYPQLKKGKK